MKNRMIILTLLLCCSFFLHAQGLQPRKGLRITRSVQFRKGYYLLPADSFAQKAVMTIEGNNLVIDGKGLLMEGQKDRSHPDQFAGLAILVKGRHITIRNFNIRGYRIALLAEGADHLVIENCDFSYNYRQRLKSTQLKENEDDWLSYHHNENREWLRYGAGIYLDHCDSAVVRNCTVTNGQNGLLMNASDGAFIYNNNFSFNSGVGLGMYRSSYAQVQYNKLNFNVRGYSDGIYQRGQDSAGILVYEQSSHNVFYRNSVTHGGDGFFLWAGQTTMDKGAGGCNDNLLLDNDFSYAPTNGIEVTFSRNRIIHNRIFECDHGIWGGYSFQTMIADNQFRSNRVGIAIEHGQEDTIYHNLFLGDETAIRLWARATQPADWAYARLRDTRSRNYVITANSFNQHPLALRLSRTDGLLVYDNRYGMVVKDIQADSTVTHFDSSFNEELSYTLSAEWQPNLRPVPHPQEVFRGNGRLAGRRQIMMTAWGPYNFQYPFAWHVNPADSSGALRIRLNGPKGQWIVKKVSGADSLSSRLGSFPAEIRAYRKAGEKVVLELEYRGAAFSDRWGNRMPEKRVFAFRFREGEIAE